MSGAVHDVITLANFDEDRFRGFGMARGRILAFSIDLLRRFYNTLALPCERVMSFQFYRISTFAKHVRYVLSSFQKHYLTKLFDIIAMYVFLAVFFADKAFLAVPGRSVKIWLHNKVSN